MNPQQIMDALDYNTTAIMNTIHKQAKQTALDTTYISLYECLLMVQGKLRNDHNVSDTVFESLESVARRRYVMDMRMLEEVTSIDDSD